jgi:hypothetical protein
MRIYIISTVTKKGQIRRPRISLEPATKAAGGFTVTRKGRDRLFESSKDLMESRSGDKKGTRCERNWGSNLLFHDF